MFEARDDGKECEPSTSSSVQWPQSCRQFDFPEILLATENFNESLVIGHGGFGKVYKGTIINGSNIFVAAIKRLDAMSKQGATEFWAEIEMLSKLRHCHLVSLTGYCNYEEEMILVYEYMPNGTLEDHLHKLGTPLSWLQRLKICIGASRGLHYLHTGTGIEFGVIHRDVKSSNILLHESWATKISDFGLSKIGPTDQPSTYVNTLVKGTFGYLDPNYFTTGRLTRKSDVYAFGVVLLEVLCRKRAVDKSLDEDQWGLATWALEFIKSSNWKHIVDSEIRGQISPKCLKDFARIVERCLHNNPKQRPTMAEIVVGLESVLTVQEKINSSLQVTGRTILGRMFDIFPFTSTRGNSAFMHKIKTTRTVQLDSLCDFTQAETSQKESVPSEATNSSNFAMNNTLEPEKQSAETDAVDSKEDVITKDEHSGSLPNQLPVIEKTEELMKDAPVSNITIEQSKTSNTTYPSQAHGDPMVRRIASNTIWANNNTIGDVREISENIEIPNPSLKVFKFADLESATRNFNQDLHLGRGHFGELFLGWIDEKTFTPSTCGDGIAVVVRRSRSITSQRHDQRLAAVSLLGQLVHPNIVSIFGYCLHGDENLLVYEYMENRTLDMFLFTDKRLPWEERLRILVGVARGLAYLHSSKDQVVCRGVQSSDILLDKNFNAKLLDFGLSKSCLEFGQTSYDSLITRRHIVDPEYTRTGYFNVKSDVYGIGVILMETLTALPAIEENTPDEQHSLLEWSRQILANKRNLKEIMDPRLKQNYHLDSAFECGALAIRCVANKPNDRPSSEEVLKILERIYAVSLIWKDALR